MPYQTINDLPQDVQHQYDPSQQTAFLQAFNAALASTDESGAFAIAHTAASGAGDKSLGIKWLANNRFVARYTNPYQDRDKEWFAEKAIDADIARMESTGEYPELWFYHVPDSTFGKVDSVFKAGRFAIATGYVFDDPTSQALKAYAQAEGYTLSHGFGYDPTSYHDQTYHDFQTFEISVLPEERASNPYTQFVAMPTNTGENPLAHNMKVRADQFEALSKALGSESAAKQFLLSAIQTSKELDRDVAYKAGNPAVIELETESETAAPEGGDLMKVFGDRLTALEDKLGLALEDMKGMFEKRYGMEAKKEAETPVLSPEQARIASLEAKLEGLETAAKERAKSVQDIDMAALMADLAEHTSGQKQSNAHAFDAASFAANLFGGSTQ